MFTLKLVSRSRRARSRLGALLTIALLLGCLVIAPPARGAPTGRPHVRVLAPGVALTTYIDRRVPVRAYVLWIDPAQGASLGMALAHDRLGELERTSDMAKDHGALVAVNGDLGSTISGRPVHPFALDGDLVQTSPVLGAMFAMSRDGSLRIGRPTEQQLSITEVDSGETSRLNVVGTGDEKEALGALIGRKGERLSALQHLVNLMLSKQIGTWTRVLVDVEDYRGRRERQLRDLAQRAAARVVETGKMLQLEPMPALERRWVHLTLRDHPSVATQSIGEEPNRRVVLVPRDLG